MTITESAVHTVEGELPYHEQGRKFAKELLALVQSDEPVVSRVRHFVLPDERHDGLLEGLEETGCVSLEVTAGKILEGATNALFRQPIYAATVGKGGVVEETAEICAWNYQVGPSLEIPAILRWHEQASRSQQ